MATVRGGGVVGGVTAMIVSTKCSWVQIPKTWMQFILANLAFFYVATILAISTYLKLNMLFQKGEI